MSCLTQAETLSSTNLLIPSPEGCANIPAHPRVSGFFTAEALTTLHPQVCHQSFSIKPRGRQERTGRELREGPNQQRQVARPQLITHTYCRAGKQINVIDDLFPNLL